MLKSNTKSYKEIRSYLDRVPVIDTHEHYTGFVKPVDDIIEFVIDNYFYSDLHSASFGMEKKIISMLRHNEGNDPVERFNFLKNRYSKTNKTAYAKGIQIGLKECWDVEKIDDEQELKILEKKFHKRDQSFYEKNMNKYCIKAQVADIYDLRPYVDGKTRDYSKYCKFVFRLTPFHDIHKRGDILRIDEYYNKTITCLDDYLENFEIYLKKCLEFGIIGIKDQTAYRRSISYSNPSKGEAEAVFNKIISNPRNVYGDDEVKALDDWLFHYFMRLAARYNLPVQLHTGHMAGRRNDIRKANAINLTSILELHQDVKFALFHGNWPYLDEYLFLGKNYPNVYLDLCWVQAIDPLYSIELMKRAIMTIPQSKIFAFGGDTRNVEWMVGYLIMARDNAAFAVSELVDSGWLRMDEAESILGDWFFNNPNEFFNLNFKKFKC